MRVSGHGTVNHPVTGASMRTTVFEIEGVGRVGEWLDYGEDEARAVRTLAAAAATREALRACLEALRAVGDNPRVMETMVIPQDAERVRAAITTAEKALGDEAAKC